MTTGGRAADRCARLFSTLEQEQEQEQEQDDRNRNWIFRVWVPTDWYRLGQLDDKTYVHTVMYRRKEVKRPSHGWRFFTGRSMMPLAHSTPHRM